MGFAAEMKDFVAAFDATSSAVGKSADRRAKRDLLRGPTDEELAGMSDQFGSGGGAIPQVSSTRGNSAKLGNRGGGQFAQQAYDYYRQKGLTDQHAKGIAANLQQESGGDPRVLSGARSGDAGKSYFAAQWQGPRLKNLYAFAGGQKPTLQQQLDFVLEEGNPKSPYRDDGAVKAFQLAQQAQTPEQVVALYRDHYERPSAQDIDKRIAHLSLINSGEGGTAVASSAPPAANPNPLGAIPDGVYDEGLGTQPYSEAGDPQSEDYSPDEGIIVDPIEMSQLAVPQVQPWEMQPQMYAASGGAIPEVQHFAAGGAPVDPYNPARAYTQALPVAPTSGFVPRRVGQAPAGGSAPGGPTASQLAFRNRPKVEMPAPTILAPVAPPAAILPTRINQPLNRVGSGNVSGTGGAASEFVWRQDPFTHKRVMLRRGATFSPYQTPTPQLRATAPPAAHYESGGVIPEPHYARGGSVRESWHAGAGRVGTGETLVDPGSRRSNSYSAADDTDYWEPVKRRPKASESSTPSGKGSGKGGKPAPAAAASDTERTMDRSGGSNPIAVEMRPDQRQSVAIASPASRAGTMVGGMVLQQQQGPAIPEGPSPNVGIRGALMREPRPEQGPPAPAAAPTQMATPAIPEMIDQRVIAGPKPQVAIPQGMAEDDMPPTNSVDYVSTPQPAGPNHAAALAKAKFDLAAGQDPRVIGEGLKNVGIPMELWPLDLQNKFLGFAEGGAVPEQRQSWHTGGSTPGVAYSDPGTDAQPERASVRPTKKLQDHVAIALDGGVRFLTDHFGLRGGGAMPSPEDGPNAQAGARRFAQGEGQTTPEEIQGIDDKIDPDRRLSEGDRQMTRIAKTMDWYASRGRPKEAKAAAASLLQYGAVRFSRLGSMAAASYKEYQTTGDPQALEHTVRYLENAYQMIPDGAQVDVAISGNKLVGTRIMADGTEEQFDVRPDELPQMIQGVQSKSSYWQQVFKLADPAGARQQAGWAHSDKNRAEDRVYREQAADTRYARSEASADQRADRIDSRAAARDTAREKSVLAREERTSKRKEVDWDVVNPLQAELDVARKALTDDPATQAAVDQAASKLWDALPPGANRAQLMKDLGIEKAEWSYTKPEVAPVAGARKAPDGNWYVQKPDGKWAVVEPASGG